MRFTAHIRKYDNKEQSVEAHCSKTGKLAAEYAEFAGLKKTAELSGKLHDIGKLTNDFNDYIHGNTRFRRGGLDHSFAGARYIKENLANSDDSNIRKTGSLIGRVILSHHGLRDWVNDDCQDTYKIRTEKDDYYGEIIENFRNSDLTKDIQSDFEKAVSEVKSVRAELKKISDNKEKFAFYLGLLERYLLSCLVDADRTNTADFMSDSKTETHFGTKQLWLDMQKRLDEKLSGFSAKNDDISVQRRSISDRCFEFAANDVGICKLIVPTGGGKTLSSLRFAVEYAKQNEMEKIIYVAPFMSILEQNSDEIRNIAGDDAFLEHHSDMLAEIANDEENLNDYELRTEKWDSPVIATSMVQFLNSLFSGKISAVRRMHRLSKAVIIIDEVQSIPLKCVYLFNLAMNFLSLICGSSIVLCSATQPPFEELKEFPLMLDKKESMTGETADDFNAFRRTELIYKEKKGGYSYDEAAEFCSEQFRIHGSLLVIVNTKSSAKEMYNRLRNTDNAYVYHLSTNMCPQHRRDTIKEIKEKLSDRLPVICVTTQLIEAGVDISFGCVVRSLAGFDNAAQAAGRCNRHGEYNKICPVFVLHLWEEKLGNLGEIKNAQSVSRELFAIAENADYLSVNVMSDYFRKLYTSGNNRLKLRYPLKDKSTDKDLINLLSLNNERIKQSNRELLFCGQAFKKAGGLFEVIDSDTKAVIVPYNEDAKEIIIALGSETNPKEIVRLLRKSQKYSVNIYSGTEQKLNEQSALHDIKCGNNDNCIVTILDSRFHNSEFGITLDSGLQEVLIL